MYWVPNYHTTIIHAPYDITHLKNSESEVNLLHDAGDAASIVGVVHSQREEELQRPPHPEQDVEQRNGQQPLLHCGKLWACRLHCDGSLGLQE